MRVLERRRVITMQRDMDFVRALLLRIEADPELNGSQEMVFDESDFPDHTQDELAYHVILLRDADFVKCGSVTSDSPVPPISRLTWEGHEFCDNIKDAGIWAKTKERTKDLPGIGLKVVAAIAEAFIKQHLGLA